MQAMIEVRLLGPAIVRTAAGHRVRHDEWKTQKNRDLLRLLAVNHGVVLPVDQVVEALWPKAALDRGRTSLRTALAHLRRVVGPEVVERVGDGIRLGPAWVDLAVYQSKVASALRCFGDGEVAAGLVAAKEAVALRVGPLLADDPFAEWAALTRSHVEQRHATLLAAAAEAALDAGLLHAAVEYGSMALRHDRCAERPARVVMAARARQGDAAAALRTFAELRRALVDELGVDPSPETCALHGEVLAGAPAPIGPRSQPAPGSTPAAPRLATATATATATGAGDAPCDGTDVADEDAVDAAPDGQLLLARLQAAVEERRGHLAVVVGPAGSGVSHLLREVSAALRTSTLVVELDPQAGIDAVPSDATAAGVLVIDGIALPGTDELAALVARAVAAPPFVLLLGCRRPASGGAAPGHEAIALSPDVTLVRLDGHPSGPRPEQRAVEADGVLWERAERARAELGPDEQELLDVLAISGAPLPAAALGRLALDLATPDAVLVGLAKLDALGVLEAPPGGYRLAPGVAELAAAWIRPARREELHARLAADGELAPALRARHLLAAGDAPGAAELFLDAARAAGRHGAATAVHRLVWDARHAIAQAGLDDGSAVTWLHRIADVAAAAGRTDDAVDALAAAVRLQQRAGVAATIPALPGLRPRAGRGPAAPAAAHAAGPSATDTRREVEVRSHLLLDRVWHERDLDAVRALDDELEELTAGPLDVATVALAQLARVEGAVWAGDGAAHLRRLRRAWPDLRVHPDARIAARAGIVFGWALHELDDPRFDEVWEQIGGLAAAADRSHLWRSLSMLFAIERGDTSSARDNAAEALVGDWGGRPDVPVALLAISRQQRRHGSVPEAISTLGSALAHARKARLLLFVPELAARLAVMEAVVDPSAAATHLALAESVAGNGRWFARERAWILLAQAAMAHVTGDADRCEDLAHRAQGAASAARLVWERAAIAEVADAWRSPAARPDRRQVDPASPSLARH